MPKLLTLNQVAESLGWSYWRVYRSRSDLGAKKHHRQWYVHEGALRAFVASFEQPQQPPAERPVPRRSVQYQYVPDPSEWGRG